MKLIFSFPKQHILQTTNNTNSLMNNDIQSKYISSRIPTPITVSLGSMFERMKHTGKCNSCSGTR